MPQALLGISALIYYFTFASLLIVAFVYDFKHKLLPDFVSYGILGLAVIRFAAVFIGYFYQFQSKFYILHSTFYFQPIFYDFATALAVLALFGGIWFFSKGRAMGLGDVKLAPALALFLGFPRSIVAILLSFWIGAIVGLILIFYSSFPEVGSLESRDPTSGNGSGAFFTFKSEIPFGPFLALGAIIALLWGKDLLAVYLNFSNLLVLQQF